MEYAKVALSALFSITVIFIITKLLGNKQLSQLKMFDYVNGITIGSIAAELATELETPLYPLIALGVYLEMCIRDSYNIRQYFDFIAGSELDGTRDRKSEVILHALLNVDPVSYTHLLVFKDALARIILAVCRDGLLGLFGRKTIEFLKGLAQRRANEINESVEVLHLYAKARQRILHRFCDALFRVGQCAVKIE